MRKREIDNFSITVVPKSLGDYGFIKVTDSHFGKTPEQIEQEYLKRCQEMCKEIERHVNNVEYTHIVFDELYYCEFCTLHCDYAENEEPNCCEKAIQEFKNLNKK